MKPPSKWKLAMTDRPDPTLTGLNPSWTLTNLRESPISGYFWATLRCGTNLKVGRGTCPESAIAAAESSRFIYPPKPFVRRI